MKKRSALAVLGIVVVLGACSSDSPSATTAGAASSSAAASSTSSTSSSSTSSSSASVAAGPTLAVKELKSATSTKLGAPIIETDSGVAVYLYKPDGTSETSTVPE